MHAPWLHVHAWSLAIVHAGTLAKVLACNIDAVQACTIAMTHACSIAIAICHSCSTCNEQGLWYMNVL